LREGVGEAGAIPREQLASFERTRVRVVELEAYPFGRGRERLALGGVEDVAERASLL